MCTPHLRALSVSFLYEHARINCATCAESPGSKSIASSLELTVFCTQGCGYAHCHPLVSHPQTEPAQPVTRSDIFGQTVEVCELRKHKKAVVVVVVEWLIILEE